MTLILFVLQHDASNTIRALHKLLSVTRNKINKIRKMVKLELAEEIEKGCHSSCNERDTCCAPMLYH